MMQPIMGRDASNPTSTRFGENVEDIDAVAAAAASTFADASLPVELSNAFGNRSTCLASSADGSAWSRVYGLNAAPPVFSGLEPCSLGGKGATCVRAVAGNVPEDLSATTMDVWSSAVEVCLLSSSVACLLVITGCALVVELVELMELVELVEVEDLVELVNVVVGTGVVVLVDVAVVVAAMFVANNSRICRSDTIKLAVFMSHRGAPSHADWSNQCVSPDHNVTAITKPACIAPTVFATS